MRFYNGFGFFGREVGTGMLKDMVMPPNGPLLRMLVSPVMPLSAALKPLFWFTGFWRTKPGRSPRLAETSMIFSVNSPTTKRLTAL